MNPYFFPLSYALVLLCLLFSACKDKNKIAVYVVSKPAPEAESHSTSMGQASPVSGPEMPAMGSSMDQSVPPPLPAQVTGIPPKNWEPQQLSSMRQASYLAKGASGATADISLVVLAGAAGGVLDNVNRWLSQLGQPTITSEQLKQLVKHVPSSLGDVSIVDLEGLPQGGDASKDGRIIAGIASGENGTFFFKMRGNAPLVESQKEGFIQWIGSAKKGETSQDFASEQVAPAPVTEVKQPEIKWDTQKDWQPAPASSMRYASFTVVGKNGESANVSVSVFGGDGGGDLANVNRWRSQIGLSALTQDDLKPLIVPLACKDANFQTIDMDGPKGRILAGWTRMDGKSWFFKLIGPAGVVEGEKEKFAAFLRSVQFHQ